MYTVYPLYEAIFGSSLDELISQDLLCWVGQEEVCSIRLQSGHIQRVRVSDRWMGQSATYRHFNVEVILKFSCPAG